MGSARHLGLSDVRASTSTGTASLLLALLACAPAHQQEQADTGPRSVGAGQPVADAPTPVSSMATIAGEWDVVSFEGHRPQRLSGTRRAAYADFGERGVGLRMECNYSGRSGTIGNGRFVASDSRGAMQTVMSCGPERNEQESRYFAFFTKNPAVERVGSDRLRLRMENTELILARPAIHRLQFVPTPAELQGEWRMLEVTRYMPGGGYTGSGLSEVPGRVVISGDRLFYNRCPQTGVTFRLSGDGKLEKTGGGGPPTGAGGCRELGEAAPAPGLPAASDVLRLLHASPAVEKTDGNSLLLATDRLGLLITKAPCESLEQSDDHRSSSVRDCASPK